MADLELNSIGNGDGNNYLLRDNSKIPLSGSNQISGDLIPSSDGTVNLGSSQYQWNNAYIKSLTINGIVAGDILTHNASEFVPRSGGNVLTGEEYKRNVDGSSLALGGGTAWYNGAFFSLSSTTRSGDFAGCFLLQATTSNSSYKRLIGYPDGTLSWSGTSIVPTSDGTCDLGSSTYGFKNIYLKNTDSKIYYGGNTLSLKCIGDGAGCLLGYAALLPSSDSAWSLGSSTFKWKNAFISGTVNCQTVVQTSDYRLKDEIESISDDVLDAWENLEPKQYKLKSDLETDKENAQVHYGWIAQDVESIIKGDRKGEVKNGLWLHESWEDQEEVSHEETYTEEVQTKSGEKQTVTKTRKVIDTPYKAKGDSYGLRYTECLVVECAYLRRENNKLKQLLQNHEERLKALEK